MKACVLHHLDPTKCRLYRPTLVQNPVFKVALGICKNPPTLRDDNDDDDGPTTGASAGMYMKINGITIVHDGTSCDVKGISDFLDCLIIT